MNQKKNNFQFINLQYYNFQMLFRFQMREKRKIKIPNPIRKKYHYLNYSHSSLRSLRSHS